MVPIMGIQGRFLVISKNGLLHFKNGLLNENNHSDRESPFRTRIIILNENHHVERESSFPNESQIDKIDLTRPLHSKNFS
jgi:hypothetical protein